MNDSDSEDSLPFPSSICHGCGAPPRYVKTATSMFILCPLKEDKYPRQPVMACDLFVTRDGKDREK